MIKVHKSLHQAGDTIVEVLIAITVVSMVLAGAFVSTRKSSKNIRNAQEQGVAIKIAESQVELIKATMTLDTIDLKNTSGPFCISTPGTLLFPSCTITNGIDYTSEVTHITGTLDYAVIVSWDGLSGFVNQVELDYQAR